MNQRHYSQNELLPTMLLESEVQTKTLDYLVDMGFVAIRVNSFSFLQQNSRFIRSYLIQNFKKKFIPSCFDNEPKLSKGFPDVLALRNDRFLLFEVKAGKGGAVSDSQKDFIKLCAIKNIEIHVVDNLNDVRNIVEGFYG